MKSAAVSLTLLSAAVPAFSLTLDPNRGSDSDSGYYTAVQGEVCDIDALTQAGYKVLEACCEGDDPERCPEYKQCRIADVANGKNVKCLCVAAPEVDDKCDADLLFPKTVECASDCKECRVSKVEGEGVDATVECGSVDVGEKECSCYAYDSCNYCRDEPPKPRVNPAEGFEVSVCGDAAYQVQTDDVTNICSGDGEAPTGDLCPKKGDLASEFCRAEVFSYGFGPQGKCEAPEDAVCMKMAKTGAWGCVFPTNANEKRGCLSENICNASYKKVEGTEMCEVTQNGYPIQEDKASPDYIDTAKVPKVSATVSYKLGEEGMATLTNVLSLIVGALTTSLAVYSSL